MPLYNFIKIVDNNNISDFLIDVSCMPNWKSRISAVRTQCIRHLDYDVGRKREIYRYFFLDYSFSCVEKMEFADLASAREHRQLIYERYRAKLSDKINTYIIKIKIDFKKGYKAILLYLTIYIIMSITSDYTDLTDVTDLTNDDELTIGDVELEVFKESIQGKSKATIQSYLQSFKKIKKHLGKDIHQTSQQLIIKTAEELSKNLNTQAAYINIGFLIRSLYNEDTKELVKARAIKKKAIIDYTRSENQKVSDGLPTLEEFDKHIEYLYDEKKYKEFVVNYLIRNCYVRNKDLVFEVIRKKADAKGQHNFMWLARGNRAVYIRRDYKTAETYGEKITEFNDIKLVTALRAIKGPLFPKPEQVGYYAKKMSFGEHGEGLLLKIILNYTRAAGDWHLLNKISQLRGTDTCTLTTSYNIQQDGDLGIATLTKSGKPRKLPTKSKPTINA